jgi:hypothetical protein
MDHADVTNGEDTPLPSWMYYCLVRVDPRTVELLFSREGINFSRSCRRVPVRRNTRTNNRNYPFPLIL